MPDQWSEKRYQVILTPIESGEEVFTSYGSHSNDFLMAECKDHEMNQLQDQPSSYSLDGFILQNNQWDSVPLDDILLPMLSEDSQRALLKFGYLGYVLL